MTSGNQTAIDIAVIGGGPAGLAAALAIASRGWAVTVLAQGIGALDTVADAPLVSDARDTRTTAVLGDGIAFLDNIGVWQRLRPVSAALTGIRIVDDRGGWLTAPEVLFDARELDRSDFGFNVPNDPLRAVLLARARSDANVTLVATEGVARVVPSEDGVTLETQEGQRFLARLVVAADGRQSIARQAAGIATRSWSYPQVAIASSFGHTLPHRGISTELHRRAGPLTTVPLPDAADGPRSSLVWIETPDEVARLMALDDADFLTHLEDQVSGFCGKLRFVGRRATFPIRGMMAQELARQRVVVAGEAAHVVPPIGAQGLNLGFRDAAAIADALGAAGSVDPGSDAVVEAYASVRRPDLVSREIGIDLLNRSLLMDFLPVQALRGVTLHALANSRTLRRAAMQMGLGPPGPVATLMRPLASHARTDG